MQERENAEIGLTANKYFNIPAIDCCLIYNAIPAARERVWAFFSCCPAGAF
jgi:hypothetical protein